MTTLIMTWTDYCVYSHVDHVMLATVWQESRGNRMVQWSMVAPAKRREGPSHLRRVYGVKQVEERKAAARRDLVEREQRLDAFCGPLISS